MAAGSSLGWAGLGHSARGASGDVGDDGWFQGDVRHLLPSVTHHRIRLKASFWSARTAAPRLAVAGVGAVVGAVADSDGELFTFDISGLAPATTHTLQLIEASGAPITDPWPLRTFPAPSASPSTLRAAAFTCAGGPGELFFDPRSGRPEPLFRPLPVRQRLLRRILALQPDVVLAIGDHVYWDMRSLPNALGLGMSPQAAATAGLFVRQLPILGTPNEGTLKRAFGPQIADLYGVAFRSTPVVFLQDDHDYTENDDANDLYRTFPADDFMREAARVTQRFYFPELLGTDGLPAAHVRPNGTATSYGALRYGDLFEAWLYDCRGGLTNSSDPATGHIQSGFVPPDIEGWLLDRSSAGDTVHGVHVPSTPVLWSAGKWLEWYPDVVGDDGALTTSEAKPYWATGWNEQHDRLLAAAAGRSDRIPLWLSGDLHASGFGTISRTNDIALSANPVRSVLAGTLGTGAPGFPSAFRGTPATPSTTVEASEAYEPLEVNGFTVLDVESEGISVAQYAWEPAHGEAAIDQLAPFAVHHLDRP